jgi:hypothetical protein
MNHPQLQPVNDAELLNVEGGGFFDWLGEVVDAVESVFRFIGQPWT